MPGQFPYLLGWQDYLARQEIQNGGRFHKPSRQLPNISTYVTGDSASRLDWAICLPLHLNVSSTKDWQHQPVGVHY